jgi:hypothetical protein
MTAERQSGLGTQGIRFGRKTDEIAKLATMDEKQKSHFRTKSGRKCVIFEKKYATN